MESNIKDSASFSIALAGKGGSGKTSIAALMIRYLIKHGLTPVLAVDADGNANLGESIGLKVEKTVGSVIADFNEEKINIPAGFTKGAYLEFKINDTIVEGKGVDLISMGRGEGTGCYCYPNTVLKSFIDRLRPNYPFMVMDNEAGMEHLSRRTTEGIDELMVISDHSVKGARTIGRILALIEELKLDIKRLSVIINRVPGALDDNIRRELEQLGVTPAAIVPEDKEVWKHDLEQKSLIELPETPAAKAVDDFMDKILRIYRPEGG
jgi:CO dehydrogenase maturation factor